MIFIRGDYQINTDKDKLQIEVIHRYLTESAYWATGRTLEMTKKTIEHSLCFGVYHRKQQVGFSRIVTDYTIFAYLCDAFVLPEYQGQGLGKWLTEAMLQVLDHEGVNWSMLATRDAHELYEIYGGYKKLYLPQNWMGRVHPDLLRSPQKKFSVPGEQ